MNARFGGTGYDSPAMVFHPPPKLRFSSGMAGLRLDRGPRRTSGVGVGPRQGRGVRPSASTCLDHRRRGSPGGAGSIRPPGSAVGHLSCAAALDHPLTVVGGDSVSLFGARTRRNWNMPLLSLDLLSRDGRATTSTGFKIFAERPAKRSGATRQRSTSPSGTRTATGVRGDHALEPDRFLKLRPPCAVRRVRAHVAGWGAYLLALSRCCSLPASHLTEAPSTSRVGFPIAPPRRAHSGARQQ